MAALDQRPRPSGNVMGTCARDDRSSSTFSGSNAAPLPPERSATRFPSISRIIALSVQSGQKRAERPLAAPGGNPGTCMGWFRTSDLSRVKRACRGRGARNPALEAGWGPHGGGPPSAGLPSITHDSIGFWRQTPIGASSETRGRGRQWIPGQAGQRASRYLRRTSPATELGPGRPCDVRMPMQPRGLH
jgi:hypothetical protein